MARRGTATTLSQDVYAQLRDAILGGRVRPGSKLSPADLRERYGVSLSVVREALTRLTEQRLVIAEPNLGFSVAPLSAEHLRELVEARCAYEGLALRMSVERGDLEWETRVIAARHRLDRTPIRIESGELNPAWITAHAAFHATLIDACGNQIMKDICSSLYDMAEMYRRWNEDAAHPARDIVKEHQDLAAAALGHDAELAERLLVEHISRTRDIAMQNIPALQRDEAAPASA